ncbi:hypothetical protein J6590_039539 [Homalodisca vitripennis]|nr:hypothetical protein J6590_039539 [Homalodisca vitripennis]
MEGHIQQQCHSLKPSQVISGGLAFMEGHIQQQCHSLKPSQAIPGGLAFMEGHIQQQCHSLKPSQAIPGGLAFMEGHIQQQCHSLKPSQAIPGGLAFMEGHIQQKCHSLKPSQAIPGGLYTGIHGVLHPLTIPPSETVPGSSTLGLFLATNIRILAFMAEYIHQLCHTLKLFRLSLANIIIAFMQLASISVTTITSISDSSFRNRPVQTLLSSTGTNWFVTSAIGHCLNKPLALLAFVIRFHPSPNVPL